MITFQAAWEKLRGGVAGGRGKVRTRVALPAVLDFPLDVLRQMRLLDPMLDGYILPDGRVWILQLVPDRARIQAGREELEQMLLDGDSDPAYSAHLKAQGFWLVAEMDFQEGTSAGAVITRCQQVLNATREEVERTYRANRAEADSTNSAIRMYQVLSDRIRSSAASDWSRQWRGRRSFSN